MNSDLLKNFLDSFPASGKERKPSCFISLENGEASPLRDLFQVRQDKCWNFDFIRDANGDDWIYSRNIYGQQFHVVFFNKMLGERDPFWGLNIGAPVWASMPIGPPPTVEGVRSHALALSEMVRDGGILVFPVSPSCLSDFKDRNLSSALHDVGCAVRAFIRIEDTNFPGTSIPLTLAVACKMKVAEIQNPDSNSDGELTCKPVLVSEFSPNEISFDEFWSEFLEGPDFFKPNSRKSLSWSWMPSKSFRGYTVERARKRLEDLTTTYAGYEVTSLSNVVESSLVLQPDQETPHHPNAIYVDRFLKRDGVGLVALTEPPKIVRGRYIQLVFGERVFAPFAAVYINSEVGRSFLEFVGHESRAMTSVSRGDLLAVEMPIPALEIQRDVVATSEEIHCLLEEAEKFRSQLIFSPNNVNLVRTDVHNMLGTIGALNKIDEYLRLIREGESRQVEFKQTLSLDTKSLTKEKRLEHSVLKTIAAFLNTDGGTLFIGVHDSQVVTGLEEEIQKFDKGQPDKFVNRFHNLVKNKLTAGCLDKFTWELESIQGQLLLVVRVKKSSIPCWLDNEFFYRSNPATDRLEGETLSAYLLDRFDSAGNESVRQ